MRDKIAKHGLKLLKTSTQVGDWTQDLFHLGLEQPRLPLWITAAQPSLMEKSIYYDNRKDVVCHDGFSGYIFSPFFRKTVIRRGPEPKRYTVLPPRVRRFSP